LWLEQRMPGYRLYFFDDRGHIQRAIELDLKADDEALAQAEQYRDGRDLELWSGTRVVARLPKLHGD
jgi:hypothetical protein